MFHGITAERYIQIYNYARKLYNSQITQFDNKELIHREAVKEIYNDHVHDIGYNQDEQKLFYLSLLVDNDEILKDMGRFYEQFFEVTKIEDYRSLEYYEKMGYKEEVQIIIEILKDYGISSEEVRGKIESVLDYYKANEFLRYYGKKQAEINNDIKKVHASNNKERDLLAEMKKFEKQAEKQDPFKYFILPDGVDVLNETPKARK